MVLFKVVAWLILVYGIIALVAKKARPSGFDLPFALPAILVGAILVVILSLIVVVGPQEVAVVTTPSGVRSEPLHTGWHVIAPWNDIHYMDKTVWLHLCQCYWRGRKPNSDAIGQYHGRIPGFDVSVSWRIDANEALGYTKTLRKMTVADRDVTSGLRRM